MIPRRWMWRAERALIFWVDRMANRLLFASAVLFTGVVGWMMWAVAGR